MSPKRACRNARALLLSFAARLRASWIVVELGRASTQRRAPVCYKVLFGFETMPTWPKQRYAKLCAQSGQRRCGRELDAHLPLSLALRALFLLQSFRRACAPAVPLRWSHCPGQSAKGEHNVLAIARERSCSKFAVRLRAIVWLLASSVV